MRDYEGREDEARNIMIKARSRMHPTRGVTVWEDLKFHSAVLQEEEQIQEWKKKMESEQILKKPKGAPKAKAKKEPKTPAAQGENTEDGNRYPRAFL